MKKFLFLFSLLSITFSLNSQNFVINEFLTSNTNDIQDNYGEFEDWIEIYNPASTAYNIAGLFFTDDLLVPLKYQIPVGNDSTIIPAGGFLLLFADKDPEQGVLHLDFKLSSTGEQIGIYDGAGNPIDTLSYGPQTSDISYGQSPDGSNNWAFFSETTPGSSNVIFYITPSLMFYEFPHTVPASVDVDVISNISWNVNNPVSWLSVNPTSGTNNGQITISIIEANPTANNRTAVIILSGTSVNDQEINIVQLGIPEIPEIVINEFMAGNSATIADNYNEYEDWIEIYNKGNTPVNVGNMYITDDLSDPTKYQIPDLFPDSTTIAPYDFLLLWADSDINQGILHLDFKLKNDGEQIGIFYSQYSAIDTLEYGQQYTDTSFGRSYDGSNAWIYFPESTPGYTNSLSINENQTSEIKCYPVPTNDILCFDLPVVSHIAILLYSSEGKLVLQKSIFDKTGSIDISSFPNGLYFLKITSNNRVYYQKIIKNQN